MSVTSKLFGQSKPAGTVNTTLFTVGGSKQAQVSLFICNQSSSVANKYRVALVPSGQVLGTDYYIVYDKEIATNQFDNITTICLNDGDFLVVRSDNGDVSFTATGLEVS